MSLLTKREVIDRLDKIIDDVMDLAIDLEFGGWEEFDNHLKDMYPDISLPPMKKEKGKIEWKN